MSPKSNAGRVSGRWRMRLHLGLTTALGAALVPLLFALHLPVRVPWQPMLLAYWVAIPLQTCLAAVILYVIEYGPRANCSQVAERIRTQKGRLWILAPFLAGLFFLAKLPMALSWGVLSVAALEVVDRIREQDRSWEGIFRALFWPMAYMFFGMLIMFAYNGVIASVRFYASYDASLNRVDTSLLDGLNIPFLVPYLSNHLPGWVFKAAGQIYSFGLFAQIGVPICLLAFSRNLKQGLSYVGTILVAYYAALLIYFLWPSLGPFYLYRSMLPHLRGGSSTHHLQMALIVAAQDFWRHARGIGVGWDYFIAFPSMHVAIPTIVLFYLRRWRRAFTALLGIDLLLLTSIILLGWHYFVDLLGGVCIAFLAIAIVDPRGVVERAAAIQDHGPVLREI